ncbi:MAG: ankyrin repeat domain-containing protein [Chromatiaceae bacterium]|nr:MAG: ankyrin repeat domain-containing protein [Chromatiaceae bacterium]
MSFLRLASAVLVATLLLGGCDEPPRPTLNLYRAVTVGDVEQIRRHLYWRTQLNEPGPDGAYPLHIAVRQGSVTVARDLLRGGARLDVQDGDGHTPLYLALANGRIPTARLLLDAGAADDLQQLFLALVAADAIDREGIALLLANDVGVNVLGPDGRAALHVAVAHGYVRLARRLLVAGADVNLPTGDGVTPAHLAAASGEPALITLLRQYGAEDPDAAD